MDIGAVLVANKIVCLSMSSVGPTKIINMSNNVCLPLNTSFIGRYKSVLPTEFVLFILLVDDLSVSTVQWTEK